MRTAKPCKYVRVVEWIITNVFRKPESAIALYRQYQQLHPAIKSNRPAKTGKREASHNLQTTIAKKIKDKSLTKSFNIEEAIHLIFLLSSKATSLKEEIKNAGDVDFDDEDRIVSFKSPTLECIGEEVFVVHHNALQMPVGIQLPNQNNEQKAQPDLQNTGAIKPDPDAQNGGINAHSGCKKFDILRCLKDGVLSFNSVAFYTLQVKIENAIVAVHNSEYRVSLDGFSKVLPGLLFSIEASMSDDFLPGEQFTSLETYLHFLLDLVHTLNDPCFQEIENSLRDEIEKVHLPGAVTGIATERVVSAVNSLRLAARK